VKTLAGRYLTQMIDELSALPDTTGKADTAWNTVELVVPHQANKTMVIDLAAKAGLSADRLYFNVETMGNTSSASIPIAIADAVTEGVIDKPTLVFAPGFGAGAVAGYSLMLVDPAVVVSTEESVLDESAESDTDEVTPEDGGTAEDASIAFGA